MNWKLRLSIVLVGLQLPMAHGQVVVPSEDTRLTFDVVSIRPSPSSVSAYSFGVIAPAEVSITGITVKELIGYAYSLKDFQILNRPKWIDTERFDISAKDTAVLLPDRKLSGQQRVTLLEENYPRLQALLADRFALTVHRVRRDVPLHALVVTNGSKLRPVACSPDGGYYLQAGFIKGAVPIRSLVALLQRDLNKPVEDKTGLSGCFDMEAKWTQSPDEEGDSAPSISTALEAFGLKLTTAKGPVEFWMIDEVREPSGN